MKNQKNLINKNQRQPNKVFVIIMNVFILLFCNALYALAVEMIIIPSGLVTGGVTGISIMLRFFNIPLNVSYIVLFLNAALYIIGAVFLGKHFMITTGASSFLYPFFLNIFERVTEKYDPKVILPIHDDLVLCALVSGLCIGVALGILMRTGASTGGSDIPPMIVSKFTGFPMGTGMFIMDGSIIVSQLLVNDIKHTLYGVIMVVVYSYIINQISVVGTSKVQISVMSEKPEEIRRAILTTIGRGVTFLSATKGLTGEQTRMVMSVVYTRQLAAAKKIVHSVDPSAFMVITRVSEVNGNGFSFYKGDKMLDNSDVM